LEKAHSLDPYHYKIVYHLALQHAKLRQMNEALECVRISLGLNKSFADCWNLLALILSSYKQYGDALKVCKVGLKECSDVNLLITKAKLEQILGDSTDAISTLKQAFVQLKDQSVNLKERDEPMNDSDRKSTRSLESSIKESIAEQESFDHKSVIYTHAMSVYSDTVSPEDEESQIAQGGTILLWLASAQIFCELGQFKDASVCVQEARNISNLSSDVNFYEGFIEELQKKNGEAMLSYEKALAVDSSHKESLIHLGELYHNQKKYLLAEKYLTAAVRQDLNCHEAW